MSAAGGIAIDAETIKSFAAGGTPSAAQRLVQLSNDIRLVQSAPGSPQGITFGHLSFGCGCNDLFVICRDKSAALWSTLLT
jgi:hypothetical protein